MNRRIEVSQEIVKTVRYAAVIVDGDTGEAVKLRGYFDSPDIAEGAGMLILKELEKNEERRKG